MVLKEGKTGVGVVTPGPSEESPALRAWRERAGAQGARSPAGSNPCWGWNKEHWEPTRPGSPCLLIDYPGPGSAALVQEDLMG